MEFCYVQYMKCSQYELSNNIYYFLFDICIHHAEFFLNNLYIYVYDIT